MKNSSYKLTLKVEEINTASKQAFKETAFLLGAEFTRVITQPRSWEGWDTRDIVDTGVLRSSQQVTFTGDFEAVYSWPVAYSVPVHEGYTLRNGVEVQGRPWTTIATQEFDTGQAFADRYRSKLGGI